MGRNISDSEGFARFLGFLIKLLIIALIVYGVYFVINKYKVIDKIKSMPEKTLEEITGCKLDSIKTINTAKEKNISKEEFINKYKGKKYKAVTDMKKLAEDGDVTYYVYSQRDKYEFKLFDLGDGYIKVVKETAKLYKEVE